MEPLANSLALLIAGAGIALLSGALLLGVGLARARRGARRLTLRLADLRRHPLIGDLAADEDPAIADATREVNALVETLRSQAATGQERVARARGGEIGLERRLRLSEERHRRLVEEAQDGVLVLQGGRIAYANPALAQLLGQERDTLHGRSFKDLVDARDLLRVLEIFSRADQGLEPAGETTCRLAAAGPPPIQARLT